VAGALVFPAIFIGLSPTFSLLIGFVFWLHGASRLRPIFRESSLGKVGKKMSADDGVDVDREFGGGCEVWVKRWS
jgi:hypothetical protein